MDNSNIVAAALERVPQRALTFADTVEGIDGVYPSLDLATRREGMIVPWAVLCYFPEVRDAGMWLVVELRESAEIPLEVRAAERMPEEFRKTAYKITLARVRRNKALTVYYHSRIPFGLAMPQAKENLLKVKSVFIGKRKHKVDKEVAYQYAVEQFPDEVQWPFYSYEPIKNQTPISRQVNEDGFFKGFQQAYVMARSINSRDDDNNNRRSLPVLHNPVKYATAEETVNKRKPRQNLLNSVQLGATPMVSDLTLIKS